MKKRAVFLGLLILALPLLAFAQDLAQQEEAETPGRVWHNYMVQQSIEFGGRITSSPLDDPDHGNAAMYNTLVNLRSGPRLLGQELSMRSLNHSGAFDSLYVSSFGFGGDPNDVARLRIEKNKWYNFVALYRRDENFFDYDLFANPMTLNPGITNCSTLTAPCTAAFNPQASYFYSNSPHYQNTTRNMGDFDLTLFPQSAIRVRLGYSINNNKGLIDSTLEDVNIDLTQQALSRSERYTVGVDVRPFKRTTLSFTEFYTHDKIDIGYVANPVNLFSLGVGGPGVFIPIYFPPCTITGPQPSVTAPGILNPLCNTGVFNYSRAENVRSNFPTSQLSLQSTYFRKLDITANGSYSSGNSKVLNYNDLFYGLVSRTDNTAYQVTGPVNTDRVSGNTDLGLTYHLTRSWSVSDKFRWLDWRDPGVADLLTNNCYSILATGETLATPTGAPCGIAGITTTGNVAAGLASSQAVFYDTLEGERSYFNTFTVNWAPSRRFSAFAGYRYARRELTTAYLAATTTTPTLAGGLVGVPGATTTSSLPLSTDKINQHTALAGVVLRPTDKWRVNADTELTSADNAFTQITPRHEQRARVNTTYKINRWASVNAAVNIIESRNDWATSFGGPGVNLFPTTDTPAYGTKSHQRYYSLGTSLNPVRRITLDAGWTYMQQQLNIPACMLVTTTVIAGGVPAACPNTTIYPTVPANFNIATQAGATNVPVTQAYGEDTNTAYVYLIFRATHRVGLNLGYEITSTSGYDNWLRGDTGLPLQVLGDIFGNSPAIPGNPGTSATGAGTIVFLGPFPDQSSASQDFNWHKASAGISIVLAKGVTFRGNWSYYDYNEKEGNISPNQLVALPRNFHANMGTLALRYAF